MDVNGVRFVLQISVEVGFGESRRIVWPEKSCPVTFSPEMDGKQIGDRVSPIVGTNRGDSEPKLRNGELSSEANDKISGDGERFHSIMVGEEETRMEMIARILPGANDR